MAQPKAQILMDADRIEGAGENARGPPAGAEWGAPLPVADGEAVGAWTGFMDPNEIQGVAVDGPRREMPQEVAAAEIGEGVVEFVADEADEAAGHRDPVRLGHRGMGAVIAACMAMNTVSPSGFEEEDFLAVYLFVFLVIFFIGLCFIMIRLRLAGRPARRRL